MTTKPLASISLDLDNLWSYMKIHGDAGWETYPTYLDPLVQTVLAELERRKLTVTVFIVGQDAALAKNERAIKSIAQAGHDIGNHSFSHEPWFHTYTREQVEREIGEAETHIERVTGKRPRGFRGPGFSVSPDALEILSDRGYLYDASTFPTFIGPLARAYYFFTTRGLSPEEREKRKKLFGTTREALRDIRPYFWDLDTIRGSGAPRSGARTGSAGTLLEIPVTTMPFARVPIHMSYLIYLSVYSRPVARAYLRSAFALCRATGVEPSFLLHPLDFMSGDRVKELAFFPGMGASTESKLELLGEVLDHISANFQPVTMQEHASAILQKGHLRSYAVA